MIEQQWLPDDQYYQESSTKTQIVLHYTAGQTVQSAIDWWKFTPGKVGTAFVVNTNGSITQCFKDPLHWAWHLGAPKLFGNRADKQSIGIEIVNVGPLTQFVDARGLGENNLYWWGEPPGKGKPWAVLPDPSRVSFTPTWRGFRYHAAYPSAQVEAIIKLLLKLTRDYGIERKLWPAERLMNANPLEAFNSKGILAHHNYRHDKSDPGPWFPWEMLRRRLTLGA